MLSRRSRRGRFGPRKSALGAGSFFWLSAALCPLFLFGTTVEGFGQSGSKADWEKILEAARKEGRVAVALPPSAELRRDVERVFGEKFRGIELELTPGPATTLASKIVSEFKAGVRNFDLFIAGPGIQLDVVAAGAAEPFEPYMILPEVRDPKHWFGGHLWVDNKTTKRFVYVSQAFFSQTLWYNAELVKPAEVRSYDDLLAPKWKGKMGIHDPRIAGPGQGLWDHLGIVKGEGYLKSLVEQDLLVSRDLRQLGDLLAKGRLALSLGTGYAVLLPFLQAGLPVKPLPTPKEGSHSSSGFGTATVMKNPPHPNAVRVFINWLLGKEGQEVYGKAMGSATRRFDVDTEWLSATGIQAAKDSVTPEEFLARFYFSEDKLLLRQQPQELAKRLLK